jgi:uncharacterized protein YjbI with pentapeptide repeats
MKSARHPRSRGDQLFTPVAAPPKPLEFANKAQDLQALRDAVVDAASVGGGLWLSYVFVFFYLAIAAGGATQRDLFFENPVKLPFLNVDLPLLWFFVLGPLLFLIVHAYTLLHFTFLADKVVAFDAQLERQIERSDPDTGELLRRQLPSNIFVQFLAGPPKSRNGMMGLLLRGIAWITLVIGPVLLLVLFQLQFLPFHSVWISWEQRLIVFADLALLWFLWPAVARRGGTFLAKGHVLGGMVWVCLFAMASLLPLLLVYTVATFPGEWLDEAVSKVLSVPTSGTWTVIGWTQTELASLRTLLVEGDIDEVTQRPISLWSNRLVMPGIDVIDHAKFDTEAKIGALPVTVSLRGRHLEGAVLMGAHLRKADFTGAFLKGAEFYHADLREAKFGCDRSGSDEDQCADIRDADLEGAQLQGASLYGARLQGADLEEAHLEGADLNEAELQGASLNNAQLQGVNFNRAQLEGANLIGAQLQGATFFMGNLDATLLVSANLEGALFVMTMLRGADLSDAQLQDAALSLVFVWRTTVRDVNAAGADIGGLETGQKYYCGELDGCKWTTKTFAEHLLSFESALPQDIDEREEILTRIAELDPDKKSDWRPDDWKLLERRPEPKDYEKKLAAKLRQIGCAAEGAPYVIHALLGARLFEHVIKTLELRLDDPAQRADIAKAFLNEEHCPGARGLSGQDKAVLREIRDRYSPARP